MTVFALTRALLWQIFAISNVAGILSDTDCIRCLCVVETNSPDCIREQCDRQSITTDYNVFTEFNSFANNNNANNNINNNNDKHGNVSNDNTENDHFTDTHRRSNFTLANNFGNFMSEEKPNRTNNNRLEHPHAHVKAIGHDSSHRKNRTLFHAHPLSHNRSPIGNRYPATVNPGIPKRSKRSCGPFNLDIHYYIKCGRPDIRHGDGDTTAFERCATSTNCSTKCVQTYVKMFNNNCPGQTSCEIWSRIHFGHNLGLTDGSGCQIPSTLAKWNEMKKCLENRKTSRGESVARNLTTIHGVTLTSTKLPKLPSTTQIPNKRGFELKSTTVARNRLDRIKQTLNN